MKDSIKANLIVFLIIATIAFTVSSAFASLTITEDNDSYKLISIQNDSFEPNYIDEVPTIIPKVETNLTNNTTTTNTTYDWNYTWNETVNNNWGY
ncbi:hypothetical protein [uncultured Methanobrevibacter sp.]|uniref:hypothetical protein n=1 Tax=uncultured Methanobrevibacter sp. TaxID=253161 RepID=UPI00261C6CD7|nr:hypothetical protein [uncultured Methanobrevibacter sp.]